MSVLKLLPLNRSGIDRDCCHRTHGRQTLTIVWLLIALLMVLVSAPVDAKGEVKPRKITPRGSLGSDEKRNVEVFRATSPSVVNINASARSRNPFTTNVDEVPRGAGTGFIWDDAGHVVTNFHVISKGNAATVTLYDQSSWPASLVGYFADRDLAVLRIEAPPEKLKPVALGSSRDLLVGQRVYAIGNPFGLDQTMSTGIVSALDREIPASNGRTLRGVIQTDAAINPGNSGGPLLDSAGLLIGVNTAIYSPSGASAGIGFAIPVDEVNRIVPRLIRDGRFIRPVIGIEAAPPGFLESIGLDAGVAVTYLNPDGPAAAAGLKTFRRVSGGRILVGDVIVGLGKYPVKTLDDLYAALERYQPGQQVELRIRRVRELIKIPLELGQGQ